MSVSTEFFVMSAAELPTVFPGWLPVRPEAFTREVVNPFTGKTSVVKTWLPAVDPPVSAAETRVPEFGNVARRAFHRIDHVKLGQLLLIMSGGDFKTRIEQLARPALIAPAESEETGLHRIDDEFATALAGLDGSRLAKTAVEWAQTEEMRRDRFTVAHCETVLCDLAKLAQQAQGSQQGLYFYWSL